MGVALAVAGMPLAAGGCGASWALWARRVCAAEGRADPGADLCHTQRRLVTRVLHQQASMATSSAVEVQLDHDSPGTASPEGAEPATSTSPRLSATQGAIKSKKKTQVAS
jgi:hypothetical protein